MPLLNDLEEPAPAAGGGRGSGMRGRSVSMPAQAKPVGPGPPMSGMGVEAAWPASSSYTLTAASLAVHNRKDYKRAAKSLEGGGAGTFERMMRPSFAS